MILHGTYLYIAHRTYDYNNYTFQYNFHSCMLFLVVYCNDSLTDPEFGEVTISSPTYPSVATYVCDEEYTLIGSPERNCTTDGTWSGEVPMCGTELVHAIIILYSLSTALDCEQLPDPINGSVMLKNSSYTSNLTSYGYNSTAIYMCDNGYNISSEIVRYCNSSGNWSGEAPVCDGTAL